ncbi:MAG: arginine repressor [Deltaproteobacteria bacterium]|nr:arginine repressor [Deltaproteobacteria bacterium]
MTKRASKSDRCQLILDLLQHEVIGSQGDLRVRLQRHGVDVNQATLSRDLRDLGVLKVPQPGGGARYVAAPSLRRGPVRHEQTLRQTVLRIQRSGNVALLHTAPGNAAVAALALDSLAPPGVLGTVAGDDTVLVLLDPGVPFNVTEEELRAVTRTDGPR